MHRIQFKILLLVFKSLHGLGPTYIRNLFTVYQPIRCLRSRNNNLFDDPKTYSQFGDRRFSVVYSKLLNNLPAQIRNSESASQFKFQLKTHLFKLAYDFPPKVLCFVYLLRSTMLSIH